MNIYIGADHRGFALKEKIKSLLQNEAYTVIDMGAPAFVEGDDYPMYAHAVAEEVAKDLAQRKGIVICGSGFGVDVVANKTDGIRAALPFSPDHIYEGRHDDDVNVLAIAADFMEEADAMKMVKVFLTAPFAKEEKYARRLEEIRAIEEKN